MHTECKAHQGCWNVLVSQCENTMKTLITQRKTLAHLINILRFSAPTVLCGAPPAVDNAFLIGRKRSHYDIHSVVRYQCADGFLQRHVPTAKCRANGKWDRPKIICIKCEFYTKGFSQNLMADNKTHSLKAAFPFVRSLHVYFFFFFFLACTPP